MPFDDTETKDEYGYPFKGADKEFLRQVWEKGQPINLHSTPPPVPYKWDACVRIMEFDQHGDIRLPNAWEVDYIIPRALGGKTEISNLQALHWTTNRLKGDQYPWACPESEQAVRITWPDAPPTQEPK
jgi:hypothetical protein